MKSKLFISRILKFSLLVIFILVSTVTIGAQTTRIGDTCSGQYLEYTPLPNKAGYHVKEWYYDRLLFEGNCREMLDLKRFAAYISNLYTQFCGEFINERILMENSELQGAQSNSWFYDTLVWKLGDGSIKMSYIYQAGKLIHLKLVNFHDSFSFRENEKFSMIKLTKNENTFFLKKAKFKNELDSCTVTYKPPYSEHISYRCVLESKQKNQITVYKILDSLDHYLIFNLNETNDGDWRFLYLKKQPKYWELYEMADYKSVLRVHYYFKNKNMAIDFLRNKAVPIGFREPLLHAYYEAFWKPNHLMKTTIKRHGWYLGRTINLNQLHYTFHFNYNSWKGTLKYHKEGFLTQWDTLHNQIFYTRIYKNKLTCTAYLDNKIYNIHTSTLEESLPISDIQIDIFELSNRMEEYRNSWYNEIQSFDTFFLGSKTGMTIISDTLISVLMYNGKSDTFPKLNYVYGSFNKNFGLKNCKGQMVLDTIYKKIEKITFDIPETYYVAENKNGGQMFFDAKGKEIKPILESKNWNCVGNLNFNSDTGSYFIFNHTQKQVFAITDVKGNMLFTHICVAVGINNAKHLIIFKDQQKYSFISEPFVKTLGKYDTLIQGFDNYIIGANMHNYGYTCDFYNTASKLIFSKDSVATLNHIAENKLPFIELKLPNQKVFLYDVDSRLSVIVDSVIIVYPKRDKVIGIVKIKNNLYLIDTQLNVLYNLPFQSFIRLFSGYALIGNCEVKMVSFDGHILKQFDSMKIISSLKRLELKSDKFINTFQINRKSYETIDVFEKNGKYGLLSPDGELLMPAEFDDVAFYESYQSKDNRRLLDVAVLKNNVFYHLDGSNLSTDSLAKIETSSTIQLQSNITKNYYLLWKNKMYMRKLNERFKDEKGNDILFDEYGILQKRCE